MRILQTMIFYFINHLTMIGIYQHGQSVIQRVNPHASGTRGVCLHTEHRWSRDWDAWPCEKMATEWCVAGNRCPWFDPDFQQNPLQWPTKRHQHLSYASSGCMGIVDINAAIICTTPPRKRWSFSWRESGSFTMWGNINNASTWATMMTLSGETRNFQWFVIHRQNLMENAKQLWPCMVSDIKNKATGWSADLTCQDVLFSKPNLQTCSLLIPTTMIIWLC